MHRLAELMRRVYAFDCSSRLLCKTLTSRPSYQTPCPGHCFCWPRRTQQRRLLAQVAASEPNTESLTGHNGRVAINIAGKFEEAIRQADRSRKGTELRSKADSSAEATLEAHREQEATDLVGESWQDVAAKDVEVLHDEADSGKAKFDSRPKQKARLYEDDEHSIRGVHIPRSAWTVLMRLRAAGHETYIVGGAVRDLLLKGQPKDFDILTSATGQQVKRLLHGSRLIGRRFPIVQVVIGGEQLEVSSFATGVQLTDLPFDAAALLGSKKAKLGDLSSTQGQGLLWKLARQQNAYSRDFTVNALLYDPFSRIVYDYTNGVEDCRQQTLRSIVDPVESFTRDPARMLRAVRLAARAGLSITEDTARGIDECKHLLWNLPGGRIVMELHQLMAYGSAAVSVLLLWKLELLDMLFPVLADYLERQNFPRNPSKPSEELLFQILARMDEGCSPEKPLSAAVWLTALASPVIREISQAPSFLGQESALVDPNSPEASKTLPGVPAEEIVEATHHLEGDKDLEEGEEEQEESEEELDESGDAPEGTDFVDESPYLEIAEDVLDAFVERPTAGVVTRATRDQALKLLAAEQAQRSPSQQDVELKCSACHNRDVVSLKAKTAPKCSACGHQLPTKLFKKRRAPEVLAVVRMLAIANQPPRSSAA